MVLDLYKKNTLSDKIIAQCLLTLIWKNRIEISKYIIKDRVNLDNIDEILKEFVNYAKNKNLEYESSQEIYNILKNINKNKGEIMKKMSKEQIIDIGNSILQESDIIANHGTSIENGLNILETDPVVSGSGSGGLSPNTNDNIYLLSAREVGFDFDYDNKKNINTDTRVLDYYDTHNSYQYRVKKDLNNTAKIWWLRSAYSNNDYYFYGVNNDGYSRYSYATYTYGVAPAFRIGTN